MAESYKIGLARSEKVYRKKIRIIRNFYDRLIVTTMKIFFKQNVNLHIYTVTYRGMARLFMIATF